MLGILNKIFKGKENGLCGKSLGGKEYISCRFLHSGIAFMSDSIRTCCSNNKGFIFVDNYKGGQIDWAKIKKQRIALINDFERGFIYQNCKNCVELEKKEWDKYSKIDYIYLNYWNHCNCGCVYCVQGLDGNYFVKEKRASDYYSVLNQIKYLYKNHLVAKNAHVELVGGDLTVLDEAEDIISSVLDYGVGRMSFHSSCIYYSKGIERAIKEAPEVGFDFSLDCSNRELYKRIKRIDAFNMVIANLKRYLKCSEKAKDYIIAKYIILDGLNDSVEEINNWLELMHSLGIKNTKIDLNFKRFFPEFHYPDTTVPEVYYKMFEHYHKKIKEYGIRDCCWEFTNRILENGRIEKI